MTVFEAAIAATAELLGWQFFPDTWEFAKVRLMPDRTTVNLTCSLNIDQIKVAEGRTKADVEAEAIYSLLTQLPHILGKQEADIMAQVEEEIKKRQEEDPEENLEGEQE